VYIDCAGTAVSYRFLAQSGITGGFFIAALKRPSHWGLNFVDWYPWYYEEYEADALHLTAVQDGIYRRLIDYYMRSRTPLPDNDLALAGAARVGLSEWTANAEIIRAFFRPINGVLHLKRCDQELDKQDNRAKLHSDRARKAAKARWRNNKDLHATSMPKAMLDDATETKTQIETKKEGVDARGALAPPLDDDILDIPPAFRRTLPAKVNGFDLATLQRAVDAYNVVAEKCSLPRVQRMTPARSEALDRRLTECGGMDGWAAALEKLAGSTFLHGHNDRGWRADFDFMLQSKSFTRLMEGAYDRQYTQHRNGFIQAAAELAEGEDSGP
jgi:uncharacterized protein YdaU (DUF1376 family)